MAVTVKPKGRALEQAVRFVQETILKSDPQLAGSNFTIESNKIINADGVRHEIDILVTTNRASTYETTHIFECKDWKKPVGKNEVLILAKKIEAVRANRGFLVARRITRDANAQIKQEKRITFVRCTDDFESPLNNLGLLVVTREFLPVRILLKERGAPPEAFPPELEWRDKTFRFKGATSEFSNYVKEHMDSLVEEDTQENVSRYAQIGIHFARRAIQMEFEPGEFLLGDSEFENMLLDTCFWVNVRRHALSSKFEMNLQGQTQVFSFDPLEEVIGGLEIHVLRRI